MTDLGMTDTPTPTTEAKPRTYLIRTHSGRLVDLSNVLPSDIDIWDIAHALANVCRYGGHTPKFYSVAQHSCYVSTRCPEEYRLEGLLHDAAEAYIGDLTRPLKDLLGERVQQLEVDIERAIALTFGLTFPWPACVKQADNYLLRIEQINFFSGTTCSETGLVRDKSTLHPLDVISPTRPDFAKSSFLAVFFQLTKRRRKRHTQSRSTRSGGS